MNDFYDEYDLKARLVPVVVLISPILISLYMYVDLIREFSTTVIVLIVTFSFSNIIMVYIRYMSKKNKSHVKRDKVVEYLKPNNTVVNSITKKRIYIYLASVDSSFDVLHNLFENNDLKNKNSKEAMKLDTACHSALNWIKENTRDLPIVKKENIYYGLFRNLHSIKSIGIFISIVSLFLNIFFSFSTVNNACQITSTFITTMLFSIISIVVWIFVVTEKLVDFCACNYAEALIFAMDSKIKK